MSNRHDTTTEYRGVQNRIDADDIKRIDPSAMATAHKVLTGTPDNYSKWFTKDAVSMCQMWVKKQMPLLKEMIVNNPHSRNIVMHGPPRACWISTQILSLPDSGFEAVSNYRSMDADH